MARLVGVGANKKVKTYTEKEVKELIENKTAELTAKVAELTKVNEGLKVNKKETEKVEKAK